MKRLAAVALLLVVAAMASAVLGDTIAYVVPAGEPGNQAFTGALGMDFNVNQDIIVKQLGVFDDNTDGLQAPLQARLYQRDDANGPCAATLLAKLDFTLDDPGTSLGDGSLFKSLAVPITLPAGFTGTIVASGYGPLEMNGNTNGGTPDWTTDDGGGLISFVGGGRFGDPNLPLTYPASGDGGPVNRYAAGTFTYTAAP